METLRRSEVQDRFENESLAPFPADRLTWNDAEFEKAHKKMEYLPCIQNQEAAYDALKALNTVSKNLGDSYSDVWKKELQMFSPEQVAMRYGYGADWSYAFHEQLKAPFEDEIAKRDTESSVTGIAKKVVRGLGKLVYRTKREIEGAKPEERKRLEHELVEGAESLFDEVYRKDPHEDQIKVTRLDGPRGPIYICVENGNHRLAAARLIGLRKVRGEVESFRDGQGVKHWYDFLMAMPGGSRQRWQKVYDDIYPPSKDDPGWV